MKQQTALGVMLSGKSVFLTGPPGAGKTYVLNQFIRRATSAGKQVAVTASTGIAATLINGTTIHSWSGLGVREQLSQRDMDFLATNERLTRRYLTADVLVVDEVSMLHGHRLDMVNAMAKLIRKDLRPFGGLQLILVGDLFQLPPINRSPQAEADFIFQSQAWDELQPTICYITEQHRHRQDGLLEILQAMRTDRLNDRHRSMLMSRTSLTFTPERSITKLYTHNADVDAINQKQLAMLDGPSHFYKLSSQGAKPKIEQLLKSILAPAELELKVGAEVMFVVNNFAEGLVNGSRGVVVDFVNKTPVIKLKTDGREVKADTHTWVLTEDDEPKAQVHQLPLRLAWAITIHKSQGMSLDEAEVDLRKTFSPGMGYVALSRVRSLNGVYLKGLNNMALKMHPLIFEFDRLLRQASEAVTI